MVKSRLPIHNKAERPIFDDNEEAIDPNMVSLDVEESEPRPTIEDDNDPEGRQDLGADLDGFFFPEGE